MGGNAVSVAIVEVMVWVGDGGVGDSIFRNMHPLIFDSLGPNCLSLADSLEHINEYRPHKN